MSVLILDTSPRPFALGLLRDEYEDKWAQLITWDVCKRIMAECSFAMFASAKMAEDKSPELQRQLGDSLLSYLREVFNTRVNHQHYMCYREFIDMTHYNDFLRDRGIVMRLGEDNRVEFYSFPLEEDYVHDENSIVCFV
jgi:hypothetical protein